MQGKLWSLHARICNLYSCLVEGAASRVVHKNETSIPQPLKDYQLYTKPHGNGDNSNINPQRQGEHRVSWKCAPVIPV